MCVVVALSCQLTNIISYHIHTEIERILIPGIRKARSEPSFAKQVSRDYLVEEPKDNNSKNVYETKDSWNAIDDINYRLNLPIHRCTTPTSTYNTLKYLFYHMKCGIYVMIRDGKLRIFSPFVNSNYRNTWGDKLTLEGDGSLNTYYSLKDGLYRDEEIEPDKSKWWANGNIICNELSKPEDRDTMQFWGDQFLAALRDMIGEACRERTMPGRPLLCRDENRKKHDAFRRPAPTSDCFLQTSF